MQGVAAAGTAGQGAVAILPPVRRPATAGRAVRIQARPSVLDRAGWFPWLPVWLSLGIGLWFALRVQPGGAVYAVAALAAVAGLAVFARAAHLGDRGLLGWRLIDALRLAGMALAVAAAGFGLAGLRSAEVAGPVLQWRYYGPIEGRVVEIDRSARDKIRVTLDRVVLANTASDRTPLRVRLSLGAEDGGQTVPVPGSRVMLTGHLGPPPGPAAPGAFDFRRQAWFEGLGGIGYTRTPLMVVTPAAEGGALWLARLRRDLSAAMQAGIGGQEGAVASALMTGDRSGIAEATNALMRDANLYHIVSISGLHMSMLAGFLYAALRIALSALAAGTGRGLALPVHKLAAAVALAAAAFYMALSDGGVATERAFVMVAVMLGAIIVDRRAISLRTVALAALILLVLSPEALIQPGFQMSFAATVALILCLEPWTRVAPRLPRPMRPVAMLLLSSLVAGLSTAPLAAAHFGRMSDYGLLANLLAVPIMGAVVMPAGVMAALLGPVGLAQPALWVMGLGTGWMLDVARFVAGLHGAVTMVPAPPGWVIPLLGAGGVLLALGGASAAGGRVLPRGLARAVGVGLLAVALGIWTSAGRPMVLIAGEAEAVGLLLPDSAGRALSKPKGGAFTVSTWLADDGDTAKPEEAAARPGWDGAAGARTALLPDGRRLVHLTGRNASAAVQGACRDRAIVILAADLDGPAPRGCTLIDQASLRRTGAIAIAADGTRETVSGVTGGRPWAPEPWRPRRRAAPGGDPGSDGAEASQDGAALASKKMASPATVRRASAKAGEKKRRADGQASAKRSTSARAPDASQAVAQTPDRATAADEEAPPADAMN